MASPATHDRRRPRGDGGHDQRHSARNPHQVARAEAAADEVFAQRKEALLQDGGKHLATKVSRDLTRSASIFKSKLANLSYGPELERFLALVTPSMTQHLSETISKFRSYQARFATRGAAYPNHIMSFMRWYEWACFEAGKHGKYQDDAQGAEPKEAVPSKPPRTNLGQVANDRKHVRALLAMCLRHNSSRRVEGLHALLNHLKNQLDGVGAVRSIDELRDSANPTVAYAFSRLVLGMATENFANVVLHCHTLCEALQRCPVVGNGVLLSVIEAELGIGVRIKAAEQRLKPKTPEEYDPEDDIDPDAIADPTVGERHQKAMAAVFAVVALLGAKRDVKPAEASAIAVMLSYCYVEHKGLRCLTGNVLLEIISKYPATLNDSHVCDWLAHTHFKFGKVDYLRPEGIQTLMHLCTAHAAGTLPPTMGKALPVAIRQALERDPLEPSVLESYATALFRKEHVTACHPLPHPVWRQFIDLMESRAMAGESLKIHIANFVHNVITPFRRGAVDGPRQDLFRKLVQWIGQLGLKAVDAEDRAQAVKEAAALGFGKKMAVGKASTPQELRALTVDEMTSKLRSLLLQYDQSQFDRSMAAIRVRTWILREVRSAMTVEHRSGVRTTYCDDVVNSLFKFGFQRGPKRDSFNENKAVYTFCDILTRSARRSTRGSIKGRDRVRTSIEPITFVRSYLELEAAGKTRFNSCKSNKVFAAVREKIVAALQPDAPRSVLFYDSCDMPILLLFLFFVVSIDDPSNEVAVGLAEASINDLLEFYATGTIATIEILVDVLMSFIMRPTAPLQVIPLMANLRPIATSMLLRLSRFFQTRAVVDMIVQPLVDAYHTDSRELRRQELARKAREEEEADEEIAAKKADSDADDDVADAASADGTEVDEEDDDGTEADGDEEESEGEEEEADEVDDSDATGSDKDVEFDDDQSWASGSEDDSSSDDDAPDEEASPEYLKNLQTMLGVDAAEAAAHVYPTDVANKEKSDVVRAVTLAARIGSFLRTPLVIHVFQVLLAVLRENVKEADDVIFDATKAAVETLLKSRNRYFGFFLSAASPTLRVLLADIQSYCRKLERALTQTPKGKEGADAHQSAQATAAARRRLASLKSLSLAVMHYLGFLAWKNNADDAVRITLAENYRMIYADRGWDTKRGPEYLRRDMFHFRHAFAWCFLDAIFSKYAKIKSVNSPKRTFAFLGACDAVRAMLPRLSGLPADLKEHAANSIREFLQGTPLKEIYTAKHTTLYEYFGAVKMTLEYNRKVHLDEGWARDLLQAVTDDDDIQISTATARTCAFIEKVLGVTARVLNIKACVPQGLLHKQFPTPFRRKATRHNAAVEKKRTQVETELLAIRNREPTEVEREQKKHRREDMRRTDRTARDELRRQRWDNLTSEEKDEARKRSKNLKQQRIALNHERKTRVHDRRAAALQKWRKTKMQSAAEQ